MKAEVKNHAEASINMVTTESIPFYSIGVTTYNRLEMLKQSVTSIINQTFDDFEVIIGNDYPSEQISPDILNINDPRVRFVNNATNLGEVTNMNCLLEISRGKYFTWLADDDVYAPHFLGTAYDAICSHEFPLVAFSSFMTGSEYIGCKVDDAPSKSRVLTGRHFLREYLSRSMKVIGCYGLFNTKYLRSIGGIEKLGNGFSPYSDNLLAIRSGLLDTLIYIDTPMIFFRTHQDSISYSSPDIDAYQSAQEALLSKSMEVLRGECLRDDFNDNLFFILRWCIMDFDSVIRRSGSVRVKQICDYFHFLQKYAALLKGSTFYRRTLILIMRTAFLLLRDVGRKRVSLQLTSTA
jgi:glycosyltransferase involved in cell wall biosynthesis